MRIEDVIAAASEELNASYESNALWFEVLINQAIKSHKTTNTLAEKQERIKIIDNKGTMPSGWIKLIGINLCSTNQHYCPDVDYTIQNDTIIFECRLGIPDNTEMLVKYKGLRTNEEGELIIPDDWERMLVAYVGWKYTRRYIKDFGVAVMQNYQREYQTQKLANV